MQYDAVSFTNISSQDFTWEWAGEPYTIKAGQTRPYPEFLARHLAKHLADAMLGEKCGNKGLREELYARMLGGVVIQKDVEQTVSEGEKVSQVVEEIEEKVASIEEKVEPFQELKEEVKLKKPRAKKSK